MYDKNECIIKMLLLPASPIATTYKLQLNAKIVQASEI